MHRLLSVCFAVTTLALISLAGCAPAQQGCNSDVDCPGLRCHLPTGQCVECLTSDECADGSAFCCNGVCLADTEIEQKCGCQADPQGESGEVCEGTTPVCQAAGARVDLLTVDQGTCGCPCTPGEGGTICNLDEEAEAGFVCGCDRTDVATCEAPTLDDDGFPHKVADTCRADETCACFSAGQVCSGVNSDCTLNQGCVNLKTDVVNCGVPARDCTNEDTGVVLTGVCQNGGCSCNAATDCQGDGINVDECAFVGNEQFCVCDDYEVNGDPAPCPLELECVAGGCLVDGTAFGSEAELLAALGVAGQSTEE